MVERSKMERRSGIDRRIYSYTIMLPDQRQSQQRSGIDRRTRVNKIKGE